MQHTDKMRAEFDEWLAEQASHGVFMGGYTFEEEAGAWAAWQASRARIVIELPDEEWIGNDDFGGFGLDPEKCRRAIEAAGVTVRG